MKKFGRFPHRNSILERESTKEEVRKLYVFIKYSLKSYARRNF